jgi:ribosome-binding factor A
MSVKIERLQNKFAIEISKIIREEIKDTRINFVTITYVKISSDLSYAKVYFTCLDDNSREETLKVLNNASKFIERKLCDLVDIRKMPELTFVYDDSIEYGNKIEDIIEKINNE